MTIETLPSGDKEIKTILVKFTSRSDQRLTSEEANLILKNVKMNRRCLAWFNFLKSVANGVRLLEARRNLAEYIRESQNSTSIISESILPQSITVNDCASELERYLTTDFPIIKNRTAEEVFPD
ncbi:hypothetical protein A2814_00010 [Candidatus Nomurabacteria bacterium RIFCSPHIGHO2_01_FULL_38_19]|uniref:Uncharacterized protein n=1 Tax=Candidatus Nomurabacteria bacterium RIFCSPHIGHO2_01_FULL_38_19 TaxID=1801732 RepID=A0A1F6UTQ5_9BACT|nr:MAG: hypothetical protein A2814_00010 [Candidatus Nomurabacteria bacterium RIFCSPHIGHO2_01_FULL_38_19]